MKKCFKCGVEQPLEDFYPHPETTDGRLGKCKKCTKADARQRRQANADSIREYEQSRMNLPHRVEGRKRYAKANPEKRAEISLEWATKNPVKRKAQNMVNNAISAGKLTRQPCERCGSGNVHGHHEDYSKPLDVMWLCPKHHKERHKELSMSF